MGQAHVIGRTEKVKQLRDLLKKTQIVYVSSFFYSGKTMLLDQLAQSQTRPVLRFSAGRDEWPAFVRAARENPDALLIVDDLQRLPESGELIGNIPEEKGISDGSAGDLDVDTADGTGAGMEPVSLREFLYSLPKKQRIVLAGRGRKPAALRVLVMTGEAVALGKDFVLFTEEETNQLFLEYGVELPPQEIAYVAKLTWGAPFVLHAVARMKANSPERSVRSIIPEILGDVEKLLISDVLPAFSGEERELMYKMALFEHFDEEMARTVTGQVNAPDLIRRIDGKSYLLNNAGRDSYSFFPVVRRAFNYKMKNLYSTDFINSLYERAALYYEQTGQIPVAISFYKKLNNIQKIRDLLILDTHMRPANGNYVELKDAYVMLPEDMILSSPELMKGMCMIETMQGRVRESERWYREIENYIKKTSPDDPGHRAAEEAAAYLDITLPHRGSKKVLGILKHVSGIQSLTQSETWRSGFNAAGNSVSLLNGGKDFCRWVPQGWRIYNIGRKYVEKALGPGGKGIGDIAIGECELESSLTGEYDLALEKVVIGLSQVTEDLELRCAALGIQSRIMMAEGNINEGILLMDTLLRSLPPDAPVRLRNNLEVQRLLYYIMKGENREALSWLETKAPDETGRLIILDRYTLMLKLRLYIITGQWEKTKVLIIKLKNYFELYDRPYMWIQLHLLKALIDRRTGKDSWKDEMAEAVSRARHFRLVRVIADEGIAVLDMLKEMDLPDTPWERGVLRLTRLQASHYPTYMRPAGTRPVFTQREQEVYSLLLAGYKNAQIASILELTERTVKHHATKVYQKLGVQSRAEAISRAAELGDIAR